MGFNFGFFGTPQHRQFNYKPVYYDPEKEALKERFGDIDGRNAKEAAERKAAAGEASEESGTGAAEPRSTYVPGQYVKGSITERRYRVERGATKAQKVLGAITLVLAFAVIYLIGKYYPMIWQ